MKPNQLKKNAFWFFALLFVFVTLLCASAQNGEMLQGGGMEANDEGFWTVTFTGSSDQPTIEFGSSETCTYGNGASLRVTCAGTEYANIIISQEVTLKANTVYMASGAIKDLTGGLLQNWWAQLKLKQADFPPDDENDGIKLYGFNFWRTCLPVDGTFQDDACDTYGFNDGEIPDLRILNENDSLVGIRNYVTPDTALETLTYHFAIVLGIWTQAGAPLPYDVVIDEISLVDSVEAAQASAIENRDFDNKINLVNYPNPFNGMTTISYKVNETSNIRLSVYNLLGEEIACLYSGKKVPGEHTATFDATNIGSNLLFCRLEINDKVIIRKMSLIK